MAVLHQGRGARNCLQHRPGGADRGLPRRRFGYVKKSLGHYVQNTGSTDLQFPEIFRASRFSEISLSRWLTHAPPSLAARHLNVDVSVISRFPKDGLAVVPA